MVMVCEGAKGLASKLLSRYYKTTLKNCGDYKGWLAMMDDPRFSTISGPLTNRTCIMYNIGHSEGSPGVFG